MGFLKFSGRRGRFRLSRFCVVGVLVFGLFYMTFRYASSRVQKTHPLLLLASGSCGSKRRYPHRLVDDLPLNQFDLCCPNPVPLPLAYSTTQSAPNFSAILSKHPDVCQGSWIPRGCIPQQKIAVLVPYRDRGLHLRLLLFRLHDVLAHQRVAYSIYVIEQAGDTPFNRGLLLNIGMRESLLRDPTISCFIFHDVDLLPEDSNNLYLCDGNLRHMASGIDEARFHSPFENYAGGVTALSRTNAILINGFPNRYWGWGNEDDELSARAFMHNLMLTRCPEYIGRYKAVRHLKAARGSGHYGTFLAYRGFTNDGLNYLGNDSYKILYDSSAIHESVRFQNESTLTNFLSFPVGQCALGTIAHHLNLSNEQQLRSAGLSGIDAVQLEQATRYVLYTHITVDVSALHKTTIKPLHETRESVWWFLNFYGWL
ncbi:unnamed protein product [Calicophoron daubneyi]|uniref:Beta-1,4-galactosyltransferase n=1 Tax=Calicophoron daubneyi TaxID=300641 RepID=A0AAV2TRK8_CALDB